MPEKLTVAEVLEMMEREKIAFHDTRTALLVVGSALFDLRAALKLVLQEVDDDASEAEEPDEICDAYDLLSAYVAWQVAGAMQRVGHAEAALSFLLSEYKDRAGK